MPPPCGRSRGALPTREAGSARADFAITAMPLGGKVAPTSGGGTGIGGAQRRASVPRELKSSRWETAPRTARDGGRCYRCAPSASPALGSRSRGPRPPVGPGRSSCPTKPNASRVPPPLGTASGGGLHPCLRPVRCLREADEQVAQVEGVREGVRRAAQHRGRDVEDLLHRAQRRAVVVAGGGRVPPALGL